MKKNKLFFILLTVIMIGIFSVSLSLGAAKVGIKDIVNIIYGKISGNENIFSYLEDSTVYIIWNIRFPRIIVSLFIGGMLSIAGVTYQG
ncbi:MAG: iron chelate uptake ABC transporter family permease subunit, partial [Tissierellales bacterium]|nr:iron chelate uptake ABC transporter family permease subunit [Tissierellales bacterium]